MTVLCPAAVNTNIHDHASMRPRELADSGSPSSSEEQRARSDMARSILALGADPLQVGERVVNAMLADEPYVFTDAAVTPILCARRTALLAAAARAAEID